MDVWASSIAAMIMVHTTTQTVNATSDPWLAGEPAGTQASQPDSAYANSNHEWKYDVAGTYGGTDSSKLYSSDYASGEPYGSPAQVSFTVNPGDTITITNVSGTASKGPGDDTYYANGADTSGGSFQMDDDSASGGVSEHGMSDVTTPGNSLVAVFLTNNTPDSGTAPSTLDFSTQAERDYTTISPVVEQPFYAGTGTNSGGSQQSIVVPAGATRMFLGSMDGHEWSNNSGGYSVTVTDQQLLTVQ